ncbi:MAG: two-component system response regulator [Rhodospirillaceae bacterium]|nr:two-component system response regulator [Magnetovibrio sp.]MAY67221.1 two-component system response regulator [Rhodospirillaceae bacterium]
MAAILVIEDDEFFQNFLELVLSGEGHEVRIAVDGEAGLAAVADQRPDLILCDMSMPKMTGFEVIRELKKIDDVKDVPVIALSAHDTAADHDEAFAAGAAAYETKPIEMDRLIDSVNQALAGMSS